MRINISLIEKLLGKNAVVIDRKGIYRITAEKNKILSPCPFFDKIDFDGLDTGKKKSFFYDDMIYVYSAFIFEDLFWIIITPD
jgi:hypothetical protein